MRLLARRRHFRAELERKLAAREYSRDEIDTTLDRLQELAFLDDLEAARVYVRLSLDRRGWGRRRLRAELSRRGVDAAITDLVLDEIDPEAERSRALRIARGWRRNRDALARHLSRKGFSSDVIVAALDQVAPAAIASDATHASPARPHEEDDHDES